ncbi:MAG: DUF1080 domain-containing protein [Sedimentisphaerales bacterium]|nr:DUF1080 domain-containing protein [Sedimentisphaerales bacterium]
MEKIVLVAALLLGHPATDTYDGWRLAIQNWTFNRFTFFDAIEKTSELGLDWMEAYPGQRLSSQVPNVVFDHNLSSEQRRQVKEALASYGIRLVNYGVVSMPQQEDQCRRIFDFAKQMGIETIIAEPAQSSLDMLERLCREYQIRLAIHNHPKPSPYWDPNTVLATCNGRSTWIGACADTGHWVRSGLDPLDCLRRLKGRVICVHMKEIDSSAQPMSDVVWGRGQARVGALLRELHAQGFKGVISIEYEADWEDNMDQVAGCIGFYNRVMRPSGWQPLFAEDLSDAILAKPGGWQMVGNVLYKRAGGDIWTKATYGNFILDLQFKTEKGTNSGVFLRAQKPEWLPWPEVQIQDEPPGQQMDRHSCGGIYDIIAPSSNAARPAGQWNRMTITADGPFVSVVLNGRKVVDMNLNDWTEPKRNPDGSPNKFDVAYKDLPRVGMIGLQDHQTPITFRNLRIRPLP